MYATVTRRRHNAARAQETNDRAEKEFFPKLREAPGFVSFTLVRGEDGINLAITLWESQAQAEAFRDAGATEWARTLVELGHEQLSRDAGEVSQQFGAEAKATA